MSKKHFIALADALKRTRPNPSAGLRNILVEQWHADINAIAAVCAAANPQFNRDRWFDYIDGACGPQRPAPLRLPVHPDE